MPYSWEAEAAATARPMPSPYMEWAPTPPQPCTNPACARALAAERRIQHALASHDEAQRREVYLLERRVAEQAEEIRRLTRDTDKGDA